MFFDTHLHSIYIDRLSYPWLESVPALNAPITFDMYRPKARCLSIESCLHMEVGVAEDACPEGPFVLNHCCVPDIAGGRFEIWAKGLSARVKRPTVTAKVSGLTAYAPQNWGL